MPVVYFPRRQYARKPNPVKRHPPINDIVNDMEMIPNVQENNDVAMVPVNQNQLYVMNEPDNDIQIVPNENDARMVHSARIQSREAELQYELEHTKETMAKREEELQQCKSTIQNLHSLLGDVDLTEEQLDVYDDIMMSNEENQIATTAVETIDESSDESVDDFNGNKENAQPFESNQQPSTANRNRTDMMFSFQHAFVENVNTFIQLSILVPFIAILFHLCRKKAAHIPT